MGLDSYLIAKVYVPKEVYPERTEQSPAVTIPGPIPGITMVAQEIRPPRGEPIVNPTFTSVLDQVGVTGKYGGSGLTVEVSVAYWRKCNQIHAWFEREVADGEIENCQHYSVEREQLIQLRDECQAIIDTVVWGEPIHHEGGPFNPDGYDEPVVLSLDTDLAEDTLPTQSGFFYGSTEYDGWYVRDLQDTVAQLQAVLDDPGLIDAEFDFHSWW